MSSHVEHLREIYEPWARGDFSNTDFMDEDFEFAYSSDFPDPAVFTRERVREGWRGWLREWRDVRIEAEAFVDAGEHVVVDVLVLGSGRVSGVEMEQPGANLWTFREDRPVRLELFAERAHARQVAGVT